MEGHGDTGGNSSFKEFHEMHSEPNDRWRGISSQRFVSMGVITRWGLVHRREEERNHQDAGERWGEVLGLE